MKWGGEEKSWESSINDESPEDDIMPSRNFK